MSESNQLAEAAVSELHEALGRCLDFGAGEEAIAVLWATVERWVGMPEFKTGCEALQVGVLNELTFATAESGSSAVAWEVIRRLAVKWELEKESDLKEMLRVTTFEIAAEAPEDPPSLVRLFSLAADRLTRWAVFAAYENVPWRLRPHALKYSGGTVSDADCDEWLASRNLGDDEVLMARLPRNET
jgi:hypothetical protein